MATMEDFWLVFVSSTVHLKCSQYYGLSLARENALPAFSTFLFSWSICRDGLGQQFDPVFRDGKAFSETAGIVCVECGATLFSPIGWPDYRARP